MDDTQQILHRVADALALTPEVMSDSDRQDILDSTLLAQLFANRQHNPFDDIARWWSAYANSLSNLHWTLTSSSNTKTALNTPFTACSALIAELQPNEQGIAQALDRLPAKSIQGLRHYCTQQDEEVLSVKVTVIRADTSNRLHIKILAFDCLSTLEDDWLNQWHTASTYLPITARFINATFSLTAAFSGIRTKVITALGPHRDKEIQPIQPKPLP